jgi:hypothetical protein
MIDKIDKIDILTFNRCMKTFSLNKAGIPVETFEMFYKNVNLAGPGIPTELCINLLIHWGYVIKTLGASGGGIHLVPTDTSVKFMEQIEGQGPRGRPEVEVSGARSRVPILKVPEEVRKSGTCSIVVQDIMNPRSIWFQLKGPRHIGALDKLMDKMTEFYAPFKTNSSRNAEYRVTSGDVEEGDVLAAPYAEDNRYYRVMVEKKFQQQEQLKFKVLYVDYGNTATVKLTDLLHLKTEFMMLPAQAIEGDIRESINWKHVRGSLSVEQISMFQTLSEVTAVFKPRLGEQWPDDPVPLEIIDEGSKRSLSTIFGDI